jgi:hypothetical protein
VIAAALLALALTQAPARPLHGELLLPFYRVHLLVHEDLDPDLLRLLARKNVVLWVRTRSNMPRTSTVENLARFPEAYLELRAPLTDEVIKVISRAPRAGAWLRAADLGGQGMHRLGPRPLAVEIEAPLDDAAEEKIRAARPARVHWSPAEEPDLLSYARLRNLPGKKLVKLAPPPRASSECPNGRPALWLDARNDRGGLPCAAGARARVSPEVSNARLMQLYRVDPAIELELEIGVDEDAAAGAVQLLKRLESVP